MLPKCRSGHRIAIRNMLPKCRSWWKSAGETCYQSVADGRDGRAEHATKVSQMTGMDGQNMLPKCRSWWESGAEVEQNRCEGGEKSAEIARKAAKIE